MYLPIIVASLFYGWKGGLAFAVLGGFLLGPLMPIDVAGNIMQEPINWLYRMVFFVMIGVIVGLASNTLKRYLIMQIEFYIKDPETHVPLITQLVGKPGTHPLRDNIKGALLIQVRFTNQYDVIDLIGNESYIELIKILGDRIKSVIKENGILYQTYR